MKSKNTGRYLVRVLGILFLVYGIGLQISGKGSGMAPVWLILGVLFLAVSVKKLYQLIFSRKWIRVILSIGAAAVAVFLVVIVVSGGRDRSAEKSDYIIVLGCQIEGELPSTTMRYRLDTAYDYLIANGGTKAVLSGGQASNEIVSEAQVMYRYLTGRGIAADRLILEEKSSDTYENLKYSFSLIRDPNHAKICIVSSRFHLLRAKLLAHKLGVPVYVWGAPTYLPLIPNFYLREMMAVVKDLVIH